MIKILESIKSLEDKKKRYQLASTYKTLLQIDDVINYHDKNMTYDIPLVVINIYGILQSLFVGIDSLYSLVIGITNNKFNINVNQNKTLNGLKHIRNDIVGHPTNRRYGQNGIAYSVIDNDLLTYNEFRYFTFIFINGVMEEKEVVVNLTEVKEEYRKEKAIIIKRLGDYIDLKVTNINLDDEIYNFYHNSTIENLDKIKVKFIEHYGNVTEHRFMWRLNLVNYILNWEDDDTEIKQLINYLLKSQTVKLLEINQQMENKHGKLPYIKIPPVLRKIYKYLDKNIVLSNYLSNLHDDNNPFYQADLDYLIKSVNNSAFLKVLDLIKNSETYETRYLLGTTVKNYRKKK